MNEGEREEMPWEKKVKKHNAQKGTQHTTTVHTSTSKKREWLRQALLPLFLPIVHTMGCGTVSYSQLLISSALLAAIHIYYTGSSRSNYHDLQCSVSKSRFVCDVPHTRMYLSDWPPFATLEFRIGTQRRDSSFYWTSSSFSSTFRRAPSQLSLIVVCATTKRVEREIGMDIGVAVDEMVPFWGKKKKSPLAVPYHIMQCVTV